MKYYTLPGSLLMSGYRNAVSVMRNILQPSFTHKIRDKINLKKAIISGEIIPFYQPIINGHSRTIYGVEILARWLTPEQKLLSPDYFIPLATEKGLLSQLTLALLKQVTRDLLSLQHIIPPAFHISFNVCSSLEWDNQLIQVIQQLQSITQGKVRIIMEVTEHQPLNTSSQLCAILNKFHRQGIMVALDDFGTGYSNIAWISLIPLNYLKIDRSFIHPITDQQSPTALLKSIISIGQRLQLGLIAEGIETEYQVNYLLDQGVYLHQGYYWSHPLSVQDLSRYLVNNLTPAIDTAANSDSE